MLFHTRRGELSLAMLNISGDEDRFEPPKVKVMLVAPGCKLADGGQICLPGVVIRNAP